MQSYSSTRLADVTLDYLRDPSLADTPRMAAFVERSVKRGWLAADGTLQGVVRSVPAEPWLRRMQIEVALTCNFSCNYCYSGSAPTRREKLAPDEIAALLDQAAEMGVSEVCFTGGEFLLYPGWRELVSRARGLGFITDIHTNGYLLDSAAAEFVVAQQVRQVQVTLESHLALVHDSIRGRHGSWERVTGNVRRALELGVNIKIVTQVHRRNLDTIAETAQWVRRELGLQVNLDRIVGSANEASEFAVSQEEFWTAVAPLLGTGVNATRVCDPAAEPNSAVEPECGVGANLVYVTADGEVALCPTMTSREHEDFTGPNIREVSLSEAWYESPVFVRYRGVNCENTGHCAAANQCTGGCRSNAYTETGRVDAPDVMACNINKNQGQVFVDFLGRYSDGKYEPVLAPVSQ